MTSQAAIERALERKGPETTTASSSGSKANNAPTSGGSSSAKGGSSRNNGVVTSSSSARIESSNNSFNSGHRTNSVELRQDLNGINQVISKQKGAVKSGSAGAFNPSMFVQHAPNPNIDGPEDGVFVDRTTHDLLIEQVNTS